MTEETEEEYVQFLTMDEAMDLAKKNSFIQILPFCVEQESDESPKDGGIVIILTDPHTKKHLHFVAPINSMTGILSYMVCLTIDHTFEDAAQRGDDTYNDSSKSLMETCIKILFEIYKRSNADKWLEMSQPGLPFVKEL